MKQWSRIIGIVAIVALSVVSSFGKVVDYRFEECSEKAEIITNHAQDALHGKLVGDAVVSKNESTLRLAGNGSVEVTHDSKLDIVGDLTLSLWVNPTVQVRQALITRGSQTGVDRKYASNGEYFLILWEDGKVKYKHNLTSDTYSNSVVSLNQWTHIGVVRSESQKKIRIYINGVLDMVNDYVETPQSSNSENLLIGSCIGCSTAMQNLQGKMDEVKLYNIGLTAQEIKTLYDAEKEGVHAQNHCYVSPAPTVVDDSLEVFEAGTVSIDVLENDVDSNTSDTCTIDASTLQLNELNGATLSQDSTLLTVSNEGTWRVVDGLITFTPEDDFMTSPTNVRYQVSDTCGSQSDTATITVTRTIVTDDTVPNEGTPTTVGTPDLVYGDSLFMIGDYVWKDTNADGLQDETEEGVEGVVVALYNSEGNVIERVTTNASGTYRFEDIAGGTYSLGFSNLPEGSIFTTQYAGDDNSMDLDVNSVGRTDQFTLESNSLDFDVGIVESDENGIDNNDSTGTDTNNDDNNTVVDHQNEDCECESYTDSIPSMGQIGVVVMLWLTTLLGLFFMREEKILIKN